MNLRLHSQWFRSDYDGMGISSTQITGTMKDPQFSQFNLSVPLDPLHRDKQLLVEHPSQ